MATSRPVPFEVVIASTMLARTCGTRCMLLCGDCRTSRGGVVCGCCVKQAETYLAGELGSTHPETAHGCDTRMCTDWRYGENVLWFGRLESMNTTSTLRQIPRNVIGGDLMQSLGCPQRSSFRLIFFLAILGDLRYQICSFRCNCQIIEVQ